MSLIAREPTAPKSPVAQAVAERVCRRVADELSQWVGAEGCRALFARALAAAQADGYPVLQLVRINAGSVYCLDGLTESATRYGPAAADEGAAAVLARLIELLGRLIGDDMALSLLEQSTRPKVPANSNTRHNGASP